VFESQLARKYCQMFSTGFNSAARDRGDVAGDIEFVGCVPPDAVEPQDGVSALGDVVRDFLEMALHRLGCRQRASRAPRRRHARGKWTGAFVALVGGLVRPRPAPGPLAHEPVLLPDAHLVLT
jgi:hypothetical protein